MRSIASLASMVLLLACASGGGEGGQDGGGGMSGRDAASAIDAASPEVDAGGDLDGGGHVVLPGRDAGNTDDAGTADAGSPDAGSPDAGTPGQCAGASDGTACDADGDGCTVDDRCMGGSCVPGPREECGGALACGSEMCVSTGPNSFRCELSGGGGGSCDDGNPCTSGDVCGPDGTCAGTPIVDSREPNDTRATARNLGSISDRDSWPYASFTANLYPDGDEDWYRYHVSDDIFGLIYPRVDLTNIPSGSDYDLCAYYRCDASGNSASCESGTSSTFEGLPGCCSRAAGSANESVRLNPSCSGSGSDDSGTVYVRVWRHSGAPVCANYTLRWGDD